MRSTDQGKEAHELKQSLHTQYAKKGKHIRVVLFLRYNHINPFVLYFIFEVDYIHSIIQLQYHASLIVWGLFLKDIEFL